MKVPFNGERPPGPRWREVLIRLELAGQVGARLCASASPHPHSPGWLDPVAAKGSGD